MRGRRVDPARVPPSTPVLAVPIRAARWRWTLLTPRRHRFARVGVKVGVKLGLCLLASLFAQAALAQVAGGLLPLLRAAAAVPSCPATQVVGACYCGPIPCKLRVVQFVPVAFVETTRWPGDSIVGSLGADAAARAGGGTVSSGLSTTDDTAESHVWLVPDSATTLLPCVMCKPSSAEVPAAPLDDAGASCGAAAAVVQAMLGAGSLGASGFVPALAYSSEADALNWRTGCRDLASGALVSPASCAGAAIEDALAGSAECLGRWGPMRPRQMRNIGLTPAPYSAKTAMRAMSIARTQLGSFPYPVDLLGRLQQAYPAASACFAPGTLPLPQSPLAAAVSRDGRYGWLYWRRTTCCVAPAAWAACAASAAAR